MEVSPEQFNALLQITHQIFDATLCAFLVICFGLGAIKGGQR